MQSRKKQTNIAIKVAMLERGWTQRETARRAGIPEVDLSLIVSGRKPTTDEQRRTIAKVLRRQVEELFPEAVAS